MLPKKHRLLKTQDFKKVYESGGSIFSPILTLRYKKSYFNRNGSKNNLRFGIIVSNKIAKKTVVRNRLKRQLRSIVYNTLKQLSAGHDLVIIARPKIRKADYSYLKKTLEGMFNRAGLYKK